MSSLCSLTTAFSIIIITLQCTMRAGAMDEELPPGPAFPRSKDADDAVYDKANDQQSAEWVKGIFESMEGLAEGDTPVWSAFRRSTDVPVDYHRLAPNRTERAVDFFTTYGLKISPVKSFPTTRRCNSVDKRLLETAADVTWISVLVVMDYEKSTPIDKSIDPIMMANRKILYALTFWNAVNLQLRHILDPQVRLRLAGISISRHRQATPYVHRHSKDDKTLDINSAYQSMRDYWYRIQHPSGNFSAKDYHIVATMTNLKADRELRSRVRAACPPSFNSPDVVGIIFHDDLAYNGVQVAVREIAHSLGAFVLNVPAKDCPSKEGHVMATKPAVIGRNWSQQSLKEISECLKSSAWPPIERKVIQPFVAPIEPILPGKFLQASEQCQQRGWKDGRVCWDKSSCDHLFCANYFFMSPCTDSGPAAEGTEFNNGEVCLDGKSISKNTLIAGSKYEYHCRLYNRNVYK